ncbi:MAG: family 16 glycosylhydrolase, partial [Micrococcales bacterium]
CAFFSVVISGLMSATAAPVSYASDGEKCTIVGTNKSETMRGTVGRDVICGLGGNDIIFGGNGNDTLDGGSGDDKLFGQDGSDLLIGATGRDYFDGGSGTNRCVWLSSDLKSINCKTIAMPVMQTPTPSATASPSQSASPTASSTATPSASASPTQSPTATATPTPTTTTPAPQIGTLINFESSLAGVTSVDFGGESSSITTAGLPAGGSANNFTALKTTKGNVSWSGVTFFAPTGTQLINTSRLSISANVWALAAGQILRMKVENNADINAAVETDAVTSTSGWQRLTWNFSSNATGTPAFNASTTYDKLSIFPEFGSTTSGDVFWIDDVALLGATPPAVGAPAPTASPTPTTPAAGVKTLLWAQEFAGAANSAPDSAAWLADLGDGSQYGNPGWGNGELEYYTNTAAKVDGQGNLAITATKNASSTPCYIAGGCYWTSAKLTTKQRFGFQYGYIETRIKTPAGAGMWPALWLLGANYTENGGAVYWPNCGEIDLMEAKGAAPYTVWGTPHSPNNHSGGTTNSSSTLDSAFHTYAINWSPDKIQWLFDGQVYFEWKATSAGGPPYPFNSEFYLIVDLAVGGSFGGGVDPNLSAGTMLIDYVRYYSVDGVGQLIRH